MPTTWPNFLFKLITAGMPSAAGTAANAAVTAVTASPILGAAADAAAKQGAEQLLRQFFPAQQEALQKIEGLARDVNSLVGDIDTRVRSMQEGAGRAARLHMEDAAFHPERAAEELQAARRLLYEAWSAATDPAQRSLAAQELSGIYAFLGHHDDSLRWLERALPDSDLAVSEGLQAFCTAMLQFSYGIPRRRDARDFVEVDLGNRRVTAPINSVLPAVQRLVEAQYDALDLRKRSTAVGVGGPWPPAHSRVERCLFGEILFSTPNGRAAVEFADRTRVGVDYTTQLLGPETSEMLHAMKTLRFSVADGPWLQRTGRTYVVGNYQQLGDWEPNHAIQLSPRRKSNLQSSILVKRNTMEAVVQVLKEGEYVEYRYFFIPDHEVSVSWERWIRRTKGEVASGMDMNPPSDYDDFRLRHDVWESSPDGKYKYFPQGQ